MESGFSEVRHGTVYYAGRSETEVGDPEELRRCDPTARKPRPGRHPKPSGPEIVPGVTHRVYFTLTLVSPFFGYTLRPRLFFH